MSKIYSLHYFSLKIGIYIFLSILLNGGILTHFRLWSCVSGLTIHDHKISLSSSANPLIFNINNKLFSYTHKYDDTNPINTNLNSVLISKPKIGFVYRKCWNKIYVRPAHLCKLNLMAEDNEHKMLKDLYLNREKHFDESLGKNCNLYRYFNITKENVRKHLDYTMEEYIADRNKMGERDIYLVDGNAFNGNPDWTLPLPRSMESYKVPEVGADAIVPMGAKESGVEPKFDHEVLDSIYKMIPDESGAGADSEESEKQKLIALYDEVGDNDYEAFEDYKLHTKQFFQDYKVASTEETKRERELLHKVMVQPTAFPSYIDPLNPVHRTGRRREIQKKRDSGRLQRLRWEMDVDSKNDIARGHWDRGDEAGKEFNDSIEWEELMPTHQDSNYFKRSFHEDGFGEYDRTADSYFDAQFIGSTDAYPFALSAGMQFTWPIYWVPWLCKKTPKLRGQPLRSPVFNLGGVEPLQLWFYPEGSAQSADGYCSLKLISPPGWNLPYRIYLYVFSEYNRVVLGPMYRESGEYIAQSLNTCRLVPKTDKQLLQSRENDKDYVVLGPAGNVYVGVGVVDEPVRSHGRRFEFRYDWDEGDYEFHQWLKKQTANPDDAFTMATVEKDRTHSIWYESHKYRHVPDRHVSRYWRARYARHAVWNPPNFQ